VKEDFCQFDNWVQIGIRLLPFQLVYLLQSLGLFLVVVLNLFMWKSFNAALQSSATSLEASLVTTASNLLVTVSLSYAVLPSFQLIVEKQREDGSIWSSNDWSEMY
jgi:hypothetical protein